MKALRNVSRAISSMSMLSRYLLLSVMCGICLQACLAVRPVGQECPFSFSSIKEMPYLPEYGSGDELYWDVVRMGKPALPDLLRCMTDGAETPAFVPNFGGNYAVGDVAFFAVMDIIHDLPVIAWTDDPEHPKFADVGFGVYWNYVRSDPGNRARLSRTIASWIKQHDHELVWREVPGHPARGWYEVMRREPVGADEFTLKERIKKDVAILMEDGHQHDFIVVIKGNGDQADYARIDKKDFRRELKAFEEVAAIDLSGLEKEETSFGNLRSKQWKINSRGTRSIRGLTYEERLQNNAIRVRQYLIEREQRPFMLSYTSVDGQGLIRFQRDDETISMVYEMALADLGEGLLHFEKAVEEWKERSP